MKKIITSTIVLLLLVIFMYPVYAVDPVDMNLPMNTNMSNEDTNVVNENSATNTNTTTNITTNTAQNTLADVPSTKVSDINSYEDSSLGITNILNIVLIVVGILLVLLSIAIMIRMK